MKQRRVDEARAAGRATIPSTHGRGVRHEPIPARRRAAVAAAVGLAGADPVAVFAEVRRRKDNF